jgi:hypothetical protein
LANRHSNPLRRLVLLYLLHLPHRLQELYLPLERRLHLPEWQVVRGKSGSYRTGGEANDNIKKESTKLNKEQNRSCSTVFLLLSNQGYRPQQTSTRALFFLVSVSFCPPPSTKRRKKVRFISILVNGLVSGFDASWRKRRANISLTPAKYLHRYSRCKHRIEKYLSA